MSIKTLESGASLQSPSSHDAANDASARRGHRSARRLYDHLNSIGILRSAQDLCKQVFATPELLMELAAILQLRDWMQNGLCECFPEQTDAAFAAMDISLKAFQANPNAFAGQEELPPLAEAIFKIWESYCAWAGLEELDADVLLKASEADEAQLLEELADFLWDHRRRS